MTRKIVDEEIADTSWERPHVVILGAGASRAAFPNGDKNGKRVPIMNDLVEVLALARELDKAGPSWEGKDFEGVYSEIAGNSRNAEVRSRIEAQIYNYFASLQLPDTPTLYDHLVLSLRPKDVIATFNWDPFLADACARNVQYGPPHTLFLHGNVRFGMCQQDNTPGLLDRPCRECGNALAPMRLLYPIVEKNYTEDPFIKAQWSNLDVALQGAYILTIFGKSAPDSDAEAIEIMKKAWTSPGLRSLEQIELIDVKSSDELAKTWQPFIVSGHYQAWTSFYESWNARHPRRTCETMWNQLMEGRYLRDKKMPKATDFRSLGIWVAPLIEAEKSLF